MRSKQLREQVLLALYFGDDPPTKRNDVIAPLVQNGLVEVTDRTPLGSVRRCKLTDAGEAYVEVYYPEAVGLPGRNLR